MKAAQCWRAMVACWYFARVKLEAAIDKHDERSERRFKIIYAEIQYVVSSVVSLS